MLMNGKNPEPTISIHALCEEGDLERVTLQLISAIFLSTPSARRATYAVSETAEEQLISIHALCEEGDTAGEAMPLHLQISIHALCEEGDRRGLSARRLRRNFYPRPLRGGRPRYLPSSTDAPDISIHALCEEGDEVVVAGLCLQGISIHALCEEGDPPTPMP